MFLAFNCLKSCWSLCSSLCWLEWEKAIRTTYDQWKCSLYNNVFPLWYWLQGLSCSRYWARLLDHGISQSTCLKLVRWDMTRDSSVSAHVHPVNICLCYSYVILSNKILSVLPKTIWDSKNWMPRFSLSHTPWKIFFQIWRLSSHGHQFQIKTLCFSIQSNFSLAVIQLDHI